MTTVTLIGKGPSAVHAQTWIDACPGTHVATVNDSGRFVQRDRIEWLFFTDLEMIRRAASLWPCVSRFVSPDNLHVDTLRTSVTPADIADDFPLDRHTAYPYQVCGRELETFRFLVRHDTVTHHSTATAAMFWLACRAGYRRLRLIGFDGGTSYAPGVDGVGPDGFDFGGWRLAQERLAQVLREERGVETEWFSAGDHPGKDQQHSGAAEELPPVRT